MLESVWRKGNALALLVPKARIDGEVGDAVIALVARLMSAELPLIAQKAKKNKKEY